MSASTVERLWEGIPGHGRASVFVDELAERAGVSRSTAQRFLRLWRAAGIAEVHGRGSGAAVKRLMDGRAPQTHTDGTVSWIQDPRREDRYFTVSIFAGRSRVAHLEKRGGGKAHRVLFERAWRGKGAGSGA